MADTQPGSQIELAAVKLEIGWADDFATELKCAARIIAGDSVLITAEHYRQAAPIAASKLLQAVTKQNTQADHAERRVA